MTLFFAKTSIHFLHDLHPKTQPKGALGMSLTICRADKRHLSDINRLIVETKIGEPMDNLDGKFWFMKVNNRVVACVGIKIINENIAILIHLAVEKPYRRQGIGMALFNHAINHLRAQGITTVALITMYYHFNRFKKRGFKTMPRKLLPELIKGHWMFTSKRYMKCAAMIQNYS